jgi:glycosyltransferase involved in cell wall biosynthesis
MDLLSNEDAPRRIGRTRMKTGVLIVGNFLSSTRRVFSVCEDLALHLSVAGWCVTTTSDKPGRLQRLLDMVRTVWRQRHAYSVAQVDVFSGTAFFLAEAVCWNLRRAKRPYVLTLHGGNLPVFARLWPERVGRLLQSAQAVTAPSRFLQEQMRTYRKDLLLIPNALDIRAYPFRLRRIAKPNLVWLRAFEKTYNPSMGPRVLALLAQDFPEIRLTMIGSDKGDGSLEHVRAEVGRLKLEERVLLVGPVAKSEVPRALSKGDIFVNTTNVDNTPVSVIEAMACGLCVASTNAGGLRYLLKDGETALLAPPNNAAALAECVRRILSEDGLAERLSRDARRQAEQFDWSVILPRWETLLRSTAQS